MYHVNLHHWATGTQESPEETVVEHFDCPLAAKAHAYSIIEQKIEREGLCVYCFFHADFIHAYTIETPVTGVQAYTLTITEE